MYEEVSKLWTDKNPNPDHDTRTKINRAKNMRNEIKLLETKYGDESITTLRVEPGIEYFTGSKKSFPLFYGKS